MTSRLWTVALLLALAFALGYALRTPPVGDFGRNGGDFVRPGLFPPGLVGPVGAQ